MYPRKLHEHAVCLCLLVGAAFAGVSPAGAALTTNIFTTHFEATEGYSTTTNLVGQNGWLGFGSGGNGVVSDYSFTNQGQQAFIGYFAPDPGDDQLSVWQPINFSPIPTNLALVQFSVLMSIVDSSTTNYDDFYWSVYNAQGNRLFTLDFNNYDLGIYYALDGTNEFVWTGKAYTNDVPYPLVVTMNFTQNSWGATLDGVLLATNQPITTTGAPLDLGDVDAVWAVFDSANPGDNYLLFDNYQITAEVLLPSAPRVQILGRTGDGQLPLRVLGQSGARFAIDATTNLTQWTALKTNVITDGYFDYVDSSAPAFARRFYRARWVP
jgi:hypothetical protein